MTSHYNNKCQFHNQGNYIIVFVKTGAGYIEEDDLDVQIQRRRLTVIVRGEIQAEGLLQGQIDVGNSKVRIQDHYVEIKLRKINTDIHWPQLFLGIPDMMTPMSHDDHVPPAMVVSPDTSPIAATKDVMTSGGMLSGSISNLMNNVTAALGDEMLDSISQRGTRQRGSIIAGN